MKSARELFEELGYELVSQDSTIIRYQKNFDIIEFYLSDNSIGVYDDWYYEQTYNEITMNELQAINKQVEELGWLDAKD